MYERCMNSIQVIRKIYKHYSEQNINVFVYKEDIMKTRSIEKNINWKEKVGETIHIVNGGEVFAMNTLREAEAEKQMRIMDGLEQIISAPAKSELFELAAEQLGIDFMERVESVYRYGRTLMMVQNARA